MKGWRNKRGAKSHLSGAYLPSGLGKVLLELLGDGGVDVAVGLGTGDPGKEKKKSEDFAHFFADISIMTWDF